MNEWVSVKERMPEKNRACLFCYHDESLEVELGYFEGEVWIGGQFNWIKEDVPFWMPLPEPPIIEVPCKAHPDAPHGFCRDESHTENRYVCECEFWKPYDDAGEHI